MAERLTWEQIQEKYPDQWVGIVDPTFLNPVTIESGIVKFTEKDMSRDEMIFRTACGELHAKYTTPDRQASLGGYNLGPAEEIDRRENVGEAMCKQTIIIGIGLAGRNIVRFLSEKEYMDEVDYLVIDTDAADLKEIKDNKNIRTILLGESICHGAGTGADMKKGALAVVSGQKDIMEALKGYRQAIIAFGAGGGTGSMVAPEIVWIAKGMGIKITALVVKPFSFEAQTRLENTEWCLDVLRKRNIEVTVFENEELRQLEDKSISMAEAFDVIHEKIAEHIKAFVSSMGCLQRVCKSH